MDHFLLHGGAAGSGVPDVGKGTKVRNIVRCLAEASKRCDQQFFKTVKSVALARDARKGRLVVRFTAVDSQLQVRSGMLGLAIGYGSRAEDIFTATNSIVSDFATKYKGMRPAASIPGMATAIRRRVHIITVDSAADEVLAAEMGRKPVLDLMAPVMPNLRIVLRDKAHASRRMLGRNTSFL